MYLKFHKFNSIFAKIQILTVCILIGYLFNCSFIQLDSHSRQSLEVSILDKLTRSTELFQLFKELQILHKSSINSHHTEYKILWKNLVMGIGTQNTNSLLEANFIGIKF